MSSDSVSVRALQSLPVKGSTPPTFHVFFLPLYQIFGSVSLYQRSNNNNGQAGQGWNAGPRETLRSATAQVPWFSSLT